MLILPLHKKPTRKNFPWVTTALILINLVVFFGFQASDYQAHQAATAHYHESSLAETEWQWFRDYPGARQSPHRERIREIESLEDEGFPDSELAALRAHTVESHPDFLDDAAAGQFAEIESDTWQEWQDKRDHYEALRAEAFTERHMLSLDRLDLTGLFTHMFLHGGVAHLFGNMLFLALLGLLVEGALGRGTYLAGYLISGLVAAGASLAVHWGTPTGSLGASGAIAGLMGLYAVLYGRRRVRFLYWFYVCFDYVRAPAIILLPLWLGWELLLFLVTDSNVAYEAHMGGIIAGALLALGIRHLGWQNDDFIEEEDRREADRHALREAREAVTALEPERAKRRLRPLLESHGSDPDVLRSWYAACKLKADDPALHEAAARILALEGDDAGERQLIVDTLRDYRKQTRPKLRPGPTVALAGRLARWGETDEARRLLDALLKLKQPPNGTARACIKLARQLLQEEEREAARNYLDHAERLSDEPELHKIIKQLRASH